MVTDFMPFRSCDKAAMNLTPADARMGSEKQRQRMLLLMLPLPLLFIFSDDPFRTQTALPL